MEHVFFERDVWPTVILFEKWCGRAVPQVFSQITMLEDERVRFKSHSAKSHSRIKCASSHLNTLPRSSDGTCSHEFNSLLQSEGLSHEVGDNLWQYPSLTLEDWDGEEHPGNGDTSFTNSANEQLTVQAVFPNTKQMFRDTKGNTRIANLGGVFMIEAARFSRSRRSVREQIAILLPSTALAPTSYHTPCARQRRTRPDLRASARRCVASLGSHSKELFSCRRAYFQRLRQHNLSTLYAVVHWACPGGKFCAVQHHLLPDTDTRSFKI